MLTKSDGLGEMSILTVCDTHLYSRSSLLKPQFPLKFKSKYIEEWIGISHPLRKGAFKTFFFLNDTKMLTSKKDTQTTSSWKKQRWADCMETLVHTGDQIPGQFQFKTSSYSMWWSAQSTQKLIGKMESQYINIVNTLLICQNN